MKLLVGSDRAFVNLTIRTFRIAIPTKICMVELFMEISKKLSVGPEKSAFSRKMPIFFFFLKNQKNEKIHLKQNLFHQLMFFLESSDKVCSRKFSTVGAVLMYESKKKRLEGFDVFLVNVNCFASWKLDDISYFRAKINKLLE